MLVRRAFHEDYTVITERMDDDVGSCFVPLSRAVEMVIGLESENVDPDDYKTWKAPQLRRVCTSAEIGSLVAQINQTTRRGLRPDQLSAEVSVDVSVVIDLIFNLYLTQAQKQAYPRTADERPRFESD